MVINNAAGREPNYAAIFQPFQGLTRPAPELSPDVNLESIPEYHYSWWQDKFSEYLLPEYRSGGGPAQAATQ